MSLSITPIYTSTLVSDLPRDSIVSKQWLVGLGLLRTFIHSNRITPETTYTATAPVFGRWDNMGQCPLCHGECHHVDLRLMSVAGLMASCENCPPGSCPVVGPLYVSNYGALKGDESVPIPTIRDACGVPRMAPMSSFEHSIPKNTALVPTGRPGSAKTYIVVRYMIHVIEKNVMDGNCNLFYFLVAPLQLLVAVTRKTTNNLVYDYFTEHNPAVLDALRMQVSDVAAVFFVLPSAHVRCIPPGFVTCGASG